MSYFFIKDMKGSLGEFLKKLSDHFQFNTGGVVCANSKNHNQILGHTLNKKMPRLFENLSFY